MGGVQAAGALRHPAVSSDHPTSRPNTCSHFVLGGLGDFVWAVTSVAANDPRVRRLSSWGRSFRPMTS